MRFRIFLTLVITALFIVTLYFSRPVQIVPGIQAQIQQRKDASLMIANVPIGGTLQARQKSLPLKGNLSFQLEMSPEQVKAGTVNVRQFNLAFFGVQQSAISGKETKSKTGVLGMTIPPSARKVQLRYDAQNRTLSGEIPVQAHFPQLDEIFPPEMAKRNREGDDDFAVSRTQPGRVKFQIKFADALDQVASRAVQSKEAIKVEGQTSATVEVEPLKDNRFTVADYFVRLSEARLVAEIGFIVRFEAANRLCIQPVRIRSGAADPTPTGAGLAFGLPGATTQWNKADVVFQVRDWMTVTNAAWKVASEGAEETDIRASVSVDDCIEIFFVENFTPESLHGGGATWSSGTANAKIITSDGNAVGGIDFTHLAHELGHVIYMGHPGNPFGMFDPSTNTLMCPSGWRRDNPTRNSQANKDHVANPLFTFVFKLRTPGPDCTASADCGACP